MKIVVFDLDETLGYFTEYGIFWDCLSNYINIKNKDALTQKDFNEIAEKGMNKDLAISKLQFTEEDRASAEPRKENT